MPSSSFEEEEKPRKTTEKSVAELLFRMPTTKLRRELEDFRVEHEKIHGPTDFTKRYTCTWPKEQADWLITYHPKLYWDGLPSFLQAFVKSRIQSKHHNGELDDVPSIFIDLYLKGSLQIRCDERGR
jgi:hypothetical protein